MINYEMALSEIEMYKKAHESLSENLTHVNKKAQQYKAERDTLIDDIAVLKANNDRYRKRTENAMDYAERSQCEVLRLERENEKLRVKRDLFFERWKFKSEMYTELYEESQSYKSLLSEISQHISNKPSSSTYKYFRAKLDSVGIVEHE